MRRIVVSEFISLDDVIEDPGGAEGSVHGGWAFQFQRGPEGDKFKLDEVMSASALLLGRKTYEGFAAAWPGRTDEIGFADKMNSMTKYVVSSTLRNPTWSNTTVISGDVAGHLRRLKEEGSGDMLVNGSRQLVGLLVSENLVDELRLMVYPIVLGSGLRLFGDGPPKTAKAWPLRLLESKAVGPDGVLTVIYEPKRG